VPATSAPASNTSAAPTGPSMEIHLFRTPVGSTTFTYRITVAGMLYQPYDSTGAPIPGLSAPLGNMSVQLDGRPINGGDGGDLQCHPHPALVPVSASLEAPEPTTVTPGQHTMVITVHGACSGDGGPVVRPTFTKTVHFTVH
jgi:hypothetical protein